MAYLLTVRIELLRCRQREIDRVCTTDNGLGVVHTQKWGCVGGNTSFLPSNGGAWDYFGFRLVLFGLVATVGDFIGRKKCHMITALPSDTRAQVRDEPVCILSGVLHKTYFVP